MTAVFVYIILGATDDRAPKGFAPIAIGLGLTIIHLASIPVTNTSVNPARSLGVAWFAGAAALSQVWLFIVAPILGAAIAGATYAAITGANGARSTKASPKSVSSDDRRSTPATMVVAGVCLSGLSGAVWSVVRGVRPDPRV